MAISFIKTTISLLILSAITFRILLLSPTFLDFILHHEKHFQTKHLCTTEKSSANSCSVKSADFTASLPWNSISGLKKKYGEGANLNGRKVRELYKNDLIDGTLHSWVEEKLSKKVPEKSSQPQQEQKISPQEEQDIATSCSKMRWQARLYSRSRHELHPFSTEYLGLRDAWVHGIGKKSWRNFVSCIAQNEEYPCPGVADLALGGLDDGEDTKWSQKVLSSCRKSNEFYNSVLDKKKKSASDVNEDL